MTPLTERYATQIAGVLSCYDRVVMTGTLPGVCFAEGMAAYLRVHGIRLFDYPHFAEPLRDEIRQHADRIARENGLEIEFIRSVHAFRAFPIDRLHRALDGFAARSCPVASRFGTTYHWSVMQVEYATDIVFHRQDDLRPLYETLVRTAIHAVKTDHVATFLGRKLTGTYRDELGNDFHTRIEGTRLKHHMGPVS